MRSSGQTAAVTEARGRVMGSAAHVIVVGHAAPAPEWALARLARLEQRWSRFRPDSEVSLLNRAPGIPLRVSADTGTALAFALDAWRRTGGRFDPTVRLDVLGYDRDLDAVRTTPSTSTAVPRRAPGCGAIDLGPDGRTVTMPAGTTFDLGGIGKGLAADLCVGELLAAGAAGACVNVGGDVRVTGVAPHGDGWLVSIDLDPTAIDDASLSVSVRVADGGIATSSRLGRRWTHRDAGDRHHLVEPTTGLPGDTGISSVSIVAGTAAWAEVLAKVAFLVGSDDAAIAVSAGLATGTVLADDGSRIDLPGFGDFRS